MPVPDSRMEMETWLVRFSCRANLDCCYTFFVGQEWSNNSYFSFQDIIVTGGWQEVGGWSRTAQTEISVNNGRWETVSRASLPMPLAYSAALTIDNQVYLFGNFSKPQRFSLKLLNDM